MPRTNPATGNSRSSSSSRQSKAVPAEPSIVVPVAAPAVMPVAMPAAVPISPAQPLTARIESSLQAMQSIALPATLPAMLPDFSRLLSVEDISDPDSFAAAGWKKVSNAERSAHKRSFEEYQNHAEDVQDGVKLLNTMALAAVAATEYGRNIIRYAIGMESIATEAVKLQIQQVDTALFNAKRAGKEADLDVQLRSNKLDADRDDALLNFREQQNAAAVQQYQLDLEALQTKLESTRRRNQSDLLELENKYPQLVA